MSDLFVKQRTHGKHTVYSYDSTRYRLREFIEELYESDVESIQNRSIDFLTKEPGTLQDVDSDLHKRFYTTIKSSDKFKTIYCSLIRDIFNEFFKGEPALIYQSFPSIRFQFVGNKCIPPHCDSDETGKHPIGERNFLLPITKMVGTTRLFIESTPGSNDNCGIDMDYGEILYFDGNKCVHYNQTNTEGFVRISFDFRVITIADYMKYLDYTITTTNPRDPEQLRKPVRMVVGGYYQCVFHNDSIEDMTRWYNQKDMILQTRPVFDKTESTACSSYFDNGDPFLTEYKETQKLEQRLATFIGAKHVCMTPSGTSAIIAALFSCGIRPGDDVIVPNYTMVATANAVRILGANPILVDVNPSTYTVDLETIRASRTERTRAIIHVTLNNRSFHIREITEYCKNEGLFLIEDAAQSLGCRHDGVHYGLFGDVGCFSLSSPKIITTGQGGFVVTNNDQLAKKLSIFKNFGRSEGGVEVYTDIGLNMKFTDIQAVIGLSQMAKIENRVTRMREIFDRYYSNLHSLSTIRILPAHSPEWIPWFIDIESKERAGIAHFLKQHNVQTRITYPSIHSLPFYNKTDSYPVSEHISNNGLFLPTHFLLTDSDIEYICRLLRIFDLSTA